MNTSEIVNEEIDRNQLESNENNCDRLTDYFLINFLIR